MSISSRIALWADKLRDISATGLRYTKDHYDTDRYRVIQDLSIEMASLATGRPVEEFEPLRETVYSRMSPLTTGVGVVLDADGRILLIRRSDSGLWALPAGGLEVGETPAEGTEREIFEETGIRAKATRLVGVFDSRCVGSQSANHFYSFVFICQAVGGTASAENCSHANEVLEVRWFERDSLPAELHPGQEIRILAAYRAAGGGVEPHFDPASPAL